MANTLKGDLLFGYDQMHKTHQPRTMFDWGSGREMEFFWDANGNLAASATRPPFVGYTDFWKGNVGSVINKAANSRWNFTGFMRTVKINMTWTTTIKNPNKR